ncbi:MAG: hypothetical protein KGJ13_00680 [Patescibacteria group bacterium]|nr:hypothetical protein [Patescibacteria group bacterium]
MKYFKPISILAPAAATVFSTALANAQDQTAPSNVLTGPGDVTNLFCGVLNWMFWGLIVLGIAMVLVAAYGYATSSGDPERAGKASKTLLYAVIAIVVGLLAQGVPFIVASFFGVNLKGAC